MTWFAWFLVGWWATGALVLIARVGKPRRPYSSTDAIVDVVATVFLVVAVLTVGTGRGL